MTAGFATGSAIRAGQLADSVRRAGARQQRVDLRTDRTDQESWRGCAEFLADPGAFPRWRAGLARWLTATYQDSPDRTTAGYVMSWYLMVPAYSAALLFHHERRVPSLRPADLAFRTAGPRPHPVAIAVLDPAFACLPDDPAAGTPDATVVADERALAAVLRGRYAAHAAQFVDAFASQVRFGRHALWGAVTDSLDTALWLAGRYGGDESAGALDAGLVLPERIAPFTTASTLRPAGAEWTRRRESCCYHYLLDRGQGVCDTCPRTGPRESC